MHLKSGTSKIHEKVAEELERATLTILRRWRIWRDNKETALPPHSVWIITLGGGGSKEVLELWVYTNGDGLPSKCRLHSRLCDKESWKPDIPANEPETCARLWIRRASNETICE